jgi:hypothetical protein
MSRIGLGIDAIPAAQCLARLAAARAVCTHLPCPARRVAGSAVLHVAGHIHAVLTALGERCGALTRARTVGADLARAARLAASAAVRCVRLGVDTAARTHRQPSHTSARTARARLAHLTPDATRTAVRGTGLNVDAATAALLGAARTRTRAAHATGPGGAHDVAATAVGVTRSRVHTAIAAGQEPRGTLLQACSPGSSVVLDRGRRVRAAAQNHEGCEKTERAHRAKAIEFRHEAPTPPAGADLLANRAREDPGLRYFVHGPASSTGCQSAHACQLQVHYRIMSRVDVPSRDSPPRPTSHHGLR